MPPSSARCIRWSLLAVSENFNPLGNLVNRGTPPPCRGYWLRVTKMTQRVEKVLFTRRRGAHRWPLRTRWLKQNGGGSGRRRAITCATDLGPRPCEATNLLVFCPA